MDPRHLREATRPEHEATEALMPLGNADLTREMYVRVLQTLAPLVGGWEHWAEAAAPEKLRALLQQRKRSHLLERDLLFMGAAPAPQATAPVNWDVVLPREQGLFSEAALLGAVYVMEGSTLGGRFIARHVESVLGLEPGRGDAYFQGHGEQTGSLWREVTALIAAVPEADGPMVIEAARRTFRAFGEALQAGCTAQVVGQR